MTLNGNCSYMSTDISTVFVIMVFIVPHGMQTPSSDENSVCLSVCLSVIRLNCDKRVQRFVHIYIPDKISFRLFF